MCPEHGPMMVEIAPKQAVSAFMGYLKRKSSIMIYKKWGNQKYKYGNRQFWCRGILCGYSREKYTGNKRIDSTSVGGGKSANNG